MKNTIIWAGQHKVASQVLLTLILITIGIVGFLHGMFTAAQGFSIGAVQFFYFSAALFLPIIILYPSVRQLKKIGVSRNYFRKWKVYDFAIVLIFLATCFLFGNQSMNQSWNNYSGVQLITEATSLPVLIQVTGSETHQKTTIKSRFKKWISKSQEALKNHVRSLQEKTKGNLTVLYLLTIAMVMSYIFLVFYASLFACSLSCNGMGVAAAFVFIGSQVLALTGFFFAVRAIIRSINKIAEKNWTKKQIMWRTIWATLGAFLSPLLMLIFF